MKRCKRPTRTLCPFHKWMTKRQTVPEGSDQEISYIMLQKDTNQTDILLCLLCRRKKKNQTVLKAPIVPQSTWKQRFSHRKDLHLCNLVPCLNLPLINLMTSSIIQSKIHQLILCRQQQHELYRAPNVWLQHTTLVALLWVADSAYKNNIIRSPACNTFSNTLVTVNVCGGFAGPYTVAQDQHTRDGL